MGNPRSPAGAPRGSRQEPTSHFRDATTAQHPLLGMTERRLSRRSSSSAPARVTPQRFARRAGGSARLAVAGRRSHWVSRIAGGPVAAERVRRAFAAARSPHRSVAVGRDDIERQVERPRCRCHVADLARDPLIDAGAADDGNGEPGCRARDRPHGVDLAAFERKRGVGQLLMPWDGLQGNGFCACLVAAGGGSARPTRSAT